jgi:hypothetical protein
MIKRPDSSTVINTGQRLILNREGVRAVATLAREQAHRAFRTYGRDEPIEYITGVADVLDWLAGGKPAPDLQRWLGIEP